MEELPYPYARIDTNFSLTREDAEIIHKHDDPMRHYFNTVRDASIMNMRTSIGPDVSPAKKNLAVFLKYVQRQT